MSPFKLIPALLIAIVSSSCFTVDVAGLTIKCDPAQPNYCPEGMQCSASAKVCMSSSATGDGGVVGDMATSTITLVPTTACPSGMGYDVTAPGKPKVYACQTKFTNNNNDTADVKCKDMYMLCPNATNVDLTACKAVGQSTTGFFIANVEAHHRAGDPPTCGAPSGGTFAEWAGCGRSSGIQTASPACMGFSQVLDCGFGSFQCQGNRIGDTINSDGASGVLCCHP